MSKSSKSSSLSSLTLSFFTDTLVEIYVTFFADPFLPLDFLITLVFFTLDTLDLLADSDVFPFFEILFFVAVLISI